MPCEADKRRTDTSDTPVSAWVKRKADTVVGARGPPEKMIRDGGRNRPCHQVLHKL